MQQFSAQNGSSFTDICLNTYGTLDKYVKMLNDNGIEPNDIPFSGQVIVWDDTEVLNQTVQTFLSRNNTIFATLTGFGVPEQVNPITTMYKDSVFTTYTASTEHETLISLPDLVGHEMVQITQEIKPLKTDLFAWDATVGTLQLLDEPLAQDETLFIISKVLASTNISK